MCFYIYIYLNVWAPQITGPSGAARLGLVALAAICRAAIHLWGCALAHWRRAEAADSVWGLRLEALEEWPARLPRKAALGGRDGLIAR